jgi:hypothetical protein
MPSLSCPPRLARLVSQTRLASFLKLLMPIGLRRQDLRQKLELPESSQARQEVAQLDNNCEYYRGMSADTLSLFGGNSGLPLGGYDSRKASAALPPIISSSFPTSTTSREQSGPCAVAQAVMAFFTG